MLTTNLMSNSDTTVIHNPRDLEQNHWLYAKPTWSLELDLEAHVVEDVYRRPRNHRLIPATRMWRCIVPNVTHFTDQIEASSMSGVLKHVKVQWTDPNIKSVMMECSEMKHDFPNVYTFPLSNNTECFEYFCLSNVQLPEQAYLIVNLHEPTTTSPKVQLQGDPLYWRGPYYPQVYWYSTAPHFHLISFHRQFMLAYSLVQEQKRAVPVHYPHRSPFRLPTFLSKSSLLQCLGRLHKSIKKYNADQFILKLSGLYFPVKDLPGVLTPSESVHWVETDPPQITLRVEACYRATIERFIANWQTQNPQYPVRFSFDGCISIFPQAPPALINEYYDLLNQDVHDPRIASRVEELNAQLAKYEQSIN